MTGKRSSGRALQVSNISIAISVSYSISINVTISITYSSIKPLYEFMASPGQHGEIKDKRIV